MGAQGGNGKWWQRGGSVSLGSQSNQSCKPNQPEPELEVEPEPEVDVEVEAEVDVEV